MDTGGETLFFGFRADDIATSGREEDAFIGDGTLEAVGADDFGAEEDDFNGTETRLTWMTDGENFRVVR